MSLTLWKKNDPRNGELGRLRSEIDRTFDRFWNEPFALLEPKEMRLEGWIPPLDVSETENELTVRAEVPGIAAKDLDISVAGNALVIAGKKDETTEKKDASFYQCERRFGSFRRVIDLPESADADKVSAESDNGVVTVHIAKKPGMKPKQVEIKPVGRKVAVTG